MTSTRVFDTFAAHIERAEIEVFPVPPLVTPTAVPDHVPVVIVPRVVIFVVPAHVESAVFSTADRPTSVLVRTTAHVRQATERTASV